VEALPPMAPSPACAAAAGISHQISEDRSAKQAAACSDLGEGVPLESNSIVLQSQIFVLHLKAEQV